MNKAALGAYLKWIMERLEESDWRVVLSDDPAPDDAYAQIEPVAGRKLATLKLCLGFSDLADETKRHTLIHEMVHLLHRDQTDIIRMGLPNVLGSQGYDLIWESFRLATEVMVDTLAYAFEDLLKKDPKENQLLAELSPKET